MEKLYLDFIEPFSRSKNWNKYILVTVDSFTHFTWLTPIRMATSKVTIQALSNIFGSFGPSVSDNASCFCSKQMRDFCFNWGIRQNYTTRYYPNPSFAERVNQNLRTALITIHHDKQASWYKSLNWLCYAFNTATHEGHRFSATELMFFFTIPSPIENCWKIEDILPEKLNVETIVQYWKTAKDKLRQFRGKLRHRYNERRRANPYRVGD